MRRWALALLLLLLAPHGAAQQAQERRLDVTLLDSTVEPKELHVSVGESIVLAVTNEASRALDFHVDGHGALDRLGPGETRQLAFTPQREGRFWYWVSAHSHAEMGQLVVAAAGAPAGSGASLPAPSARTLALGLVIVPALFGLVGFLEPCSLGANTLFLAYLRRVEPARRVREASVFVVARAGFLGLVGLAVASLGALLLPLQRGYNAAIGAAFLLGGLAYLVQRARPGWFGWASLSLGRLLAPRPGKMALYGAAFGLSAPICAAPLLFVLLAGSFLLGPAEGFVVMAVFGLALSLPLLVFASSRRGVEALRRLNTRAGVLPAAVGALLLAIGLYLLYTGLAGDPFGGLGHDWMARVQRWTGRA